VERHNIWSRVSAGAGLQGCWNYLNRRDHSHHRCRVRYQQLVGLLAVALLTPAKAQDGGTTAIANPVATSSGSVSNQAVQINQGGYSQQSFAVGNTCNSGTLVFTPFFLGNDVRPSYVRNQNYGAQVSFSFPLDGGMVELCKDTARKRLEKERLDLFLVRYRECAKIHSLGYMIRPESPYAAACADVVPIAAYQKTKPSSPASSEPSSPQS